MTRNRGLALAVAVAGATVAVDRLTKIWAENNLAAGPCGLDGEGCIDLVGSLRLHLIYNPGAAFTTGTGLGPLFAVVAAVMTVVLLRMAASSSDRTRVVLLGLIAGGAVGNLVDRVIRAESGPLSGSVIDFVDLQWWPVFNVADAAVVCGVLAFVLYSMRQPLPEPSTGPAGTDGVGPTVDDGEDREDGYDDGDGAPGDDDGLRPGVGSGPAHTADGSDPTAEAGG